MKFLKKAIVITAIFSVFMCMLCACNPSSEKKDIDSDTKTEITNILSQTNAFKSLPVSIYTTIKVIFYDYDVEYEAVNENIYNVTFSGYYRMNPSDKIPKDDSGIKHKGSVTYSVDLNNKTCEKIDTEGSVNNAFSRFAQDTSWISSGHVNYN